MDFVVEKREKRRIAISIKIWDKICLIDMRSSLKLFIEIIVENSVKVVLFN